jgi:DnaK suppressor protein
VEDQRARELLSAERERLSALLGRAESDGQLAREGQADELDQDDDTAEQLTAENVEDALSDGFQRRLDAVARAEQRLADGTYGRSVRSGDPIPDERLEADPAAELTVEESAADEDDRD